jgi:dTDP-4-dehydrorhamnose reductase
MRKKILITGSNGLLGQKLLEQLKSDESYEIIATSKGEDRSLEKDGYTYINLDITNEKQIHETLGSNYPDVIINTAAMTNVDACESLKDECLALNVKAVEYFINSIEDLKSENKNYNPHFIHLSTDFIFDGSHGPLTEEAKPNPLSFYAESKLAAEHIIIASKIKWSIARTVLVYGVTPNMSRSNIVLWVKKSLEEGKEINVVDDQFRTPTLAEDLAEGCILIAKKEATGIFNISGEEFMSIFELANRVGKFWDLNTELIQRAKSETIKQPAKRPPITGFIIDKAKKELGFMPHKFEDGLKLVDKQLERKP